MEFCTVLQKCNGSKRDKLTVPFYMTRIVTRNKEILAKPELMNAFQDDFMVTMMTDYQRCIKVLHSMVLRLVGSQLYKWSVLTQSKK